MATPDDYLQSRFICEECMDGPAGKDFIYKSTTFRGHTVVTYGPCSICKNPKAVMMLDHVKLFDKGRQWFESLDLCNEVNLTFKECRTIESWLTSMQSMWDQLTGALMAKEIKTEMEYFWLTETEGELIKGRGKVRPISEGFPEIITDGIGTEFQFYYNRKTGFIAISQENKRPPNMEGGPAI